MKPINVPNLFPKGTVLSADRTSISQQLWNAYNYAIQIEVTGTPTGSFKLQASCDPFQSGIPGYPFNWTDVDMSSTSIVAAGSIMWNVIYPGYNYVRVVYTDGSSGASTATVQNSTINVKGSQ